MILNQCQQSIADFVQQDARIGIPKNSAISREGKSPLGR
jgi:hypothetical protein